MEDTGRDLLEVKAPFRVTDLKQWVYCPRILYYHACLPDVRPFTYKMKAGIEEGINQEGLEGRRSLHAYGLAKGRREFNVRLISEKYGLRGAVDMVIWAGEPPEEIIPVDYKLSEISGEHFQIQLMAYGLMLEEYYGLPARRGFLYEIPNRKSKEIKFTSRLRQKLLFALESMHHMLWSELTPEPTPNRNKCLACEFRRFCNDVV